MIAYISNIGSSKLSSAVTITCQSSRISSKASPCWMLVAVSVQSNNVVECIIDLMDYVPGPATWSLEMSREYPKTQFYGCDISAVFPQTVKPQNCHFDVANILTGLPYPDNHFDFVHQRLLTAGFRANDWVKVANYYRSPPWERLFTNFLFPGYKRIVARIETWRMAGIDRGMC